MPAKKIILTDEERAQRLQDTAREVEADATEEAFDRAFEKIVVTPKPESGRKPESRAG